MSTTHRINAEHVLLSLVARRALKGRRWAAMSDGAHTNPCGASYGRFAAKHPPLMVPMTRGRMNNVVEHVRLNWGLPEVRKTWGAGYRAMLEETAGFVL